MPSSRGFSQPRDQILVWYRSPASQADSLPSEPPGKPQRIEIRTWSSWKKRRLYLFLNQHSYSLLFQYHQVFTYERLPGLWINVNKSTQVFIKNKINNSHSLLPISQTLPEPVRLNNFPDAKHLELTQGSCFRSFSFLSNLGASHVDIFINTHLHDGGKVGTTADFIFLGSKITTDGNCSHEVKRYLLLERKANDKPREHIKKQR